MSSAVSKRLNDVEEAYAVDGCHLQRQVNQQQKQKKEGGKEADFGEAQARNGPYPGLRLVARDLGGGGFDHQHREDRPTQQQNGKGQREGAHKPPEGIGVVEAGVGRYRSVWWRRERWAQSARSETKRYRCAPFTRNA